MHVFPGSPQVCCSRPTSSPVLYPRGGDRGGSAGSGRGRDQLPAGPGARPTGRASTTAAGCQAGPLPFPGFLGFGNERVAGRYAGREALLKSAVLPRKQVNRWKEGAVVKGDKSINEPIFIISLMMVLKPLDRKGKVGATRALVSGPRGRQERRGGVGRLPGKFVR